MRTSNVFLPVFFVTFCLLFCVNSVEAQATKNSTFTVPIHRSMGYQEVRHQAEQQTNAYISSFFSQNPSTESLRLEVLGERVVEIVPIFSVFITRTQWQESPHISDWVSYNQASFSLLQRERPLIASVEENPVAPNSLGATFDYPIERPVINQSIINSLDESGIEQLIEQGTDPQGLVEQGVNPQFLIDELD